MLEIQQIPLLINELGKATNSPLVHFLSDKIKITVWTYE
jgi:hypothetical protein